MRFPGRRGPSGKTNSHLYFLSFREVVNLKNRIPHLPDLLMTKAHASTIQINMLYEEFEAYLQHGGYLTATMI